MSIDVEPKGSAKNESNDSKEKSKNTVDERSEVAKVSLPLKRAELARERVVLRTPRQRVSRKCEWPIGRERNEAKAGATVRMGALVF